jgi:hypothetical protein
LRRIKPNRVDLATARGQKNDVRGKVPAQTDFSSEMSVFSAVGAGNLSAKSICP